MVLLCISNHNACTHAWVDVVRRLMGTVHCLFWLPYALKGCKRVCVCMCAEARAAVASPRRAWLVHREYEFAVEVTAGPPNSVFRHTKVTCCSTSGPLACLL